MFVGTTSRKAFYQGVRIGIGEERDRQPCAGSDIRRRVGNPVCVRPPAVIGPHFHHIADIDDEPVRGRDRIDPFAGSGQHLQPAWRFIRQKNSV